TDGGSTSGGHIRGDDGRKANIGDTYTMRVRVRDNAGNTYEQILTIIEGGIYVYTDTNNDDTANAGEVRQYSGFLDAQGNGLLAENLEGVQDILLGKVGNPGGESLDLAGHDANTNDNDEFRYDTTTGELRYVGKAGGNSGNFESTTPQTKRVEFTKGTGPSATTEEYVIRLANVNDAPVVTANSQTPIRVTESTTDNVQSVTLTTDMITVTDQDAIDNDNNGDPLGSIRFTVSNLQNGYIEVQGSDDTWTQTTGFTLQQLRDGQVRFTHDGGEQFEVVNGFKSSTEPRPTQFTLTANDGKNSGTPTQFTVEVLNSPTAAIPAGSSVRYVNDAPTLATPATVPASYQAVPTSVDEIYSIAMTFGGHASNTQERIEFTFNLPAGFSSTNTFWANIHVEVSSGPQYIKGLQIRITEDENGLQFSVIQAKFIELTGPNAHLTPDTVNFDSVGTNQDVAIADSGQHSAGYGFKNLKVNGVLLGGNYIARDTIEIAGPPLIPRVADDPSHTAFTEQVTLYNFLEGQTTILTSRVLSASDVDNTPAEVTFTLTAVTTNGVLQKMVNNAWTTLADGGSFTQADINAGRVRYVHNGDEDATSDTFTVTISDTNGGRLAGQTITLAITPLNDAPAFGDNRIVNMQEGTGDSGDIGYILTTSDIGVTDPDDEPENVTYTYTTALGSSADLQKRGAGVWTDLSVGDTFTLRDVMDGNVRILHDGTQSSATAINDLTFGLRVDDDQTGLGNTAPVSGTVNVYVAAVNDAPTLPVASDTKISPDKIEGDDTEIYFTITDEETADDTGAGTSAFTYSLVSGRGDRDNA
ncbi:MAG: hypothetical protein OXT03_06180, partial [Alphaproteobacteria bacterium]|nr:hypothetical protein [Alphaproteobacteria bacterium]